MRKSAFTEEQIAFALQRSKRQCPRWQYKYRNMEIIDNGDGTYGLRGVWTTAGPTM